MNNLVGAAQPAITIYNTRDPEYKFG